MKSVPISEFKAKCLSLVEEVRQTGQAIELTKRGKVVAVVGPPPKGTVDWTPGAFRDQIYILGDIQGDLSDLGVEWDAMR